MVGQRAVHEQQSLQKSKLGDGKVCRERRLEPFPPADPNA